MCVLSVELRLKALPHWLHLCGFSCGEGRAHHEAEAPARRSHLGGHLEGAHRRDRGLWWGYNGNPWSFSPQPHHLVPGVGYGSGQTRGPRTWVWIILCLQSVLAWRKPLPQTLHTNDLAPVWTGMWRVRL